MENGDENKNAEQLLPETPEKIHNSSLVSLAKI